MKRFLFALALSSLYFMPQAKAADTYVWNNADSAGKTGFILHENKVVFQKVFSSNLNQQALRDKILMLLNTRSTFRFKLKKQVHENELFLSLFQHQVNMLQYDFGTFNSPRALYTPFNARVVIQIKNHKYRVTVSEINFQAFSKGVKDSLTQSFFLEDLITDRRGQKIEESKSNLRIMHTLEDDLSRLFDIKNLLISRDF